MNKFRIVSAIMVMALIATALAAIPLQSTAQVNSYDDSLDATAQRHGYYQALVAAATTGATAITQDGSGPARGVATDSARWVALGEFYTESPEAKRERAAQADVARWVAQGEFYEPGFDLTRGAAADSARWVALGKFYASLISQDGVGCQGEEC